MRVTSWRKYPIALLGFDVEKWEMVGGQAIWKPQYRKRFNLRIRASKKEIKTIERNSACLLRDCTGHYLDSETRRAYETTTAR